MDPLLIAVTVVALGLAGAMGAVLAKLLREERRRSEARVAALTDLSAERVSVGTPPPVPAAPQRSARPFSAGDVAIPRAPVSLAPASKLFAEPERPSPWGTRLAVIGVLATVVVLAIAVSASRPHAPAAGPAQTATTPVAQTAPLELLSLRYEQQTDRMTITGLVQNPRKAAPLSHVTATAFLFGADGSFLASGRAPIDYTALAPGEESPFIIRVPVTGTVARYRVGFRGDDGRVIAHVDRRATGTLAERSAR